MPKQIIRNLRRENFHFAKLIPNLVTLTSLCITLSAIRFALSGNFVNASVFLLIAGFMDELMVVWPDF